MKEVKNITIKKKTAERFQQFSKTHYKAHTDAMAGMLDFFFYNVISPKENFGPTGRRIEKSLKKRINAVIAMMNYPFELVLHQDILKLPVRFFLF